MAFLQVRVLEVEVRGNNNHNCPVILVDKSAPYWAMLSNNMRGSGTRYLEPKKSPSDHTWNVPIIFPVNWWSHECYISQVAANLTRSVKKWSCDLHHYDTAAVCCLYEKPAYVLFCKKEDSKLVWLSSHDGGHGAVETNFQRPSNNFWLPMKR